jgi:ABC-type spermidine/putrescine transport system permease subunit I
MSNGRRLLAQSKVLLLSPFAILFSFIFFLPIVFLVILSFTTKLGVGADFTLDNYARAMSPDFLFRYVWSLAASAASSGIAALVGFPIAFFLARGKGAWTSIVQISVLVPLFGLIYYAFAFLFSFSRGGIVNYVLLILRIIPAPIDFIIGSNRAILIIIAMGLTSVPLTSLVMTGAIQGIDPALEEVALCCGANEFQTFRRVTLALVRKSLLAAVLLVFGANIVAFTFPLVLGFGDNRWIAVEILNLASNFLQYTLTSALAVVLIGITSVISYAYIRLTKS